MRKAERASFIHARLDQLFPETPIPLDHTNAFTLLVAVLLSAQCTDLRVNKITPELFDLASDPKSMAALGWEEINRIVRPCGLAPRKAQAIQSLSEILVAEHNGEVPASFEDLEKLPGVGHKTASVVMAQAFGVPAFPIDTHIHRLAQMWGLTSGKSVKQTEIDLKKLFPKEAWNRLHLQIIFFGREYCPSRTCNGLRCELCQKMFPRRVNPRRHKK